MIKRIKCFRNLFCGLMLCAFMTSAGVALNIGTKVSIVYAESLSNEEIVNTFSVGEYKTCDDAHKIKIQENGTVTFDDAYTLTASESEGTYVLDGKLGTDNKAVKFVQLNNHALICVSHIKYTIDETSYIIYQNTPFLMDYTPVENADGGIEVWNNNVKSATFGDFQSAFVYATSGDTIKLTKNLTISEGSALMGKTLTIDGVNFTLDKSSWANTVFAVADNATLNIKNLTIDGKATGWEVDFGAVTFTNGSIPLKANSADNDPITVYPVITTSGKLIADNLTVKNVYSTTLAYGSALAISKGEVELINSEFNHNSAKNGGAMLIGYSLLETALEEYPVRKVTLINTDFKNNYASASNGGAVYVIGATEIDINNCEFDTNVCNGNKGGAILIENVGNGNGYGSTAHKLGLDFVQVKIDDSLFNNNWAGNDGFAIENHDAEMEITNTDFIGNVGTQLGGGSIGTVSCSVVRAGYWAKQTIKNCLFKENRGAVSCIGDHNTNVSFQIENTKFEENKGKSSLILFYAGIATIQDCEFNNNNLTNPGSIIQIVPASSESGYAGSGKKTATVVLKDSTFSGNDGTSGVQLASYNHSNTSYVEPELYIEGETNVDIRLMQEGHVIINGTLTGDISLDEKTPINNISVSENGKLNGDVAINATKYNTTFNYVGENEETVNTILKLSVNYQYSNEEIQELLGISKEGYVFKVYTNKNYTTEWNYIVTKTSTLYGRWEEHAHTFDSYVANGNSINRVCGCGKIEGSLSISANENLVYNGESKRVSVSNTLSIDENEYTISYLKELGKDIWVSVINPVNAGSYKAVLKYQENTIELLFDIEKATIDMSQLRFESKEFTVDGNVKSLEVEGLPQGVSVTYVGNGKTETGIYLVTAKFSVDSENYNEIDDMSAILQIKEELKETSSNKDIKTNLIYAGIGCGAGIVLSLIICAVISLIRRKKQ